MRLLLLPISTRRTLVYCEPLSSITPGAQQSYLEKAVAYANKTWSTWEKAESGWKLKATQYGNQLFRRIPYEEWGLKSIPPIGRAATAEGSKDKPEKMVEVRFPPEFQALSKTSVMDSLRTLATERQALHRKRMIWSIVGMPITAPFGLLPIVPNIPFFYLAFRAYSHWRALSGSRHLEHLIKTNRLKESPLGILDSLYAAGLLHPSRASSRNAEDPSPAQSKRVAELVRQQMAGGEVIAMQSTSPMTDSKGNDMSISTLPLDDAPTATAPTTNPDTSPNNDPKSNDHPSLATKEGESQEEEEILLLQGWNGKLLAERLELPSLEVEIERAVEQVEKSLETKGAGELQKEKREMERVREAYLARKKAGATSTPQERQPQKAAK